MVEAITREEFYKAADGSGSIRSPEAVELGKLNITDGFRVPCRWAHHPTCNGARLVRIAAKKIGIKTHCTCKDGTLYVLRTA